MSTVTQNSQSGIIDRSGPSEAAPILTHPPIMEVKLRPKAPWLRLLQETLILYSKYLLNSKKFNYEM